MQNYEPLAKKHKIVGFSGLKPIHENYSFPLVKLPSPVDLPNFPFKMPVLNRLFFGDAMYLFGLEKKLKGFDVVHVRETYFHFTQQALDAKERGFVKKVVCTCSETIPFNHEGIWNRKNFKQRAIKEVDVFHCLTQKARQCLIKEGCNPKKIIVFPYGIHVNKFSTQNHLQACGKKHLRILFVGRLVKEKGLYDILNIFVSLYKSSKNINLSLVGGGQEQNNIISLINQIRLNKVIKVRKVPYSRMFSEYNKADIFCLLSKPTKHWEEYFGMALIEAMASGLPIITTKCGAIPEVIGNAGILINPGDCDKGVRELKKLISNPDLRKKLGILSRQRAVNFFACKKSAKNIEKLWLS